MPNLFSSRVSEVMMVMVITLICRLACTEDDHDGLWNSLPCWAECFLQPSLFGEGCDEHIFHAFYQRVDPSQYEYWREMTIIWWFNHFPSISFYRHRRHHHHLCIDVPSLSSFSLGPEIPGTPARPLSSLSKLKCHRMLFSNKWYSTDIQLIFNLISRMSRWTYSLG